MHHLTDAFNKKFVDSYFALYLFWPPAPVYGPYHALGFYKSALTNLKL